MDRLWIDRTASDNVCLPAECPAKGTHCGTQILGQCKADICVFLFASNGETSCIEVSEQMIIVKVSLKQCRRSKLY